MPACLKCGAQNSDGSTFCANSACGAYLGWQQTPPPEIEARPPGPKVVAQRQDAKRIAVSAVMRPGSLNVAPGAAVGCEVTVRNSGTIVDQFTVAVVGPAAGWATVMPSSLSLFPGAEGTVRITIQPPRTSATPAAPMSLRITITSREDPAIKAVEEGLLTVGAFNEISVGELVPQTSQGHRRTEHGLTITNGGNVPFRADLRASDPESQLEFEIRPAAVSVAPGDVVPARVRLRAKKRLWLGAPQTRAFNVRVQAEGQPPIARVGAMRQTALLPSGIVPLALGAIALIAVAVPLWIFASRNLGINATPTAATSSSASASGQASASASASTSASATVSPSVTTTPTTAATASLAAQFAATWLNDDSQTSGIVELVITNQGDVLTVHGYGKCSPTCDWGTRSVTYTGSPVTVLFDFGNGLTHQLTMSFPSSNGHLSVDDNSSSSGVHPYTFHRSAVLKFNPAINPGILKVAPSPT